MNTGMLCKFKKCKCGKKVMIMFEDNIQDGDLINHSGCESKEIKEDENKKWKQKKKLKIK